MWFHVCSQGMKKVKLVGNKGIKLLVAFVSLLLEEIFWYHIHNQKLRQCFLSSLEFVNIFFFISRLFRQNFVCKKLKIYLVWELKIGVKCRYLVTSDKVLFLENMKNMFHVHIYTVYSETSPIQNLDKADTYSIWTIFMVLAKMVA